MAGAGPGMRDVRCNVCHALGDHYSSHCPRRGTVGVPVAHQAMADTGPGPLPGADAATATAATAAPGSQCTADFPPLAILGPAYLSPSELLTAIRTRSDVPDGLKCVLCGCLAEDATWCSVCDSIACAPCLGLSGYGFMCACRATSPDTFFVVGAVRRMVQAWFCAAAEQVDPAYSKAPSLPKRVRNHSSSTVPK